MAKLSLARAAPETTALTRLDQLPDVAELRERIAAHCARLAEAETRRARASRPSSAPKPTASAVDRAALLLAGGKIPSAEPGAEIIAADAEAEILKSAIAMLREELSELEAHHSYLASLECQARHIAALRRIDRALSDAFTGLSECYEIAQELRAAGYSPSVSVLPANVPAALWALNDPASPGGQAGVFRRWLAKTFPVSP